MKEHLKTIKCMEVESLNSMEMNMKQTLKRENFKPPIFLQIY